MNAKTMLVLMGMMVLGAGAETWNCNPLGWKVEGDRALTAFAGSGEFAIRGEVNYAECSVTARVTPVGTGTNGWSVAGVAVLANEQNFWHVALVQSPPEMGAHHTFELCEKREGTWLAHSLDHLRHLRGRSYGSWKFGEQYELSIALKAGEVSATVKSVATGKLLFESAFAIGPQDAAVRVGRAALHHTGGFRAEFSEVATVSVRPVGREREQAAVVPYRSESFVPGVTDRATGFFRVVNKDGRWWTIDPLGRGMVLLGIDHVTYHGHYSARTGRRDHLEYNKRRFPNKRDWEEDALRRLKSWGFNFLGAGCDEALKHRGLAHTIFLSIGDALCWDENSPDLFICPNEHRPCSAFPNVFHPRFEEWANWVARRRCAPNRDDPWLFGYFIDNELAWWGRGASATGLFDAVSRLPENHSARAAQRRFLAERGVKGEPSADDKLAFLRLAAERYFSVASAAIRRHDPNHLVMGARFAGLGGAHPAVWEVSGKYCDVVTFNCYPWADIDRNVVLMHQGTGAERVLDTFTRQFGYVKKPMLVTEWSFPALDSGLPCTGGAGQRFHTQAQRTQATELFAKTMLSLPFLLGYDYFMWVDEPAAGISDAFPEDSNYGLITEKGEAYPEITSMFRRLHADVGRWRRSAPPAERKVLKRSNDGVTVQELLKRNSALATGYSREGDRYRLVNSAGMTLEGRVGGQKMFDAITLKGKLLGTYNGMLNDVHHGGLRWCDTQKVLAAEWRGGALLITAEGWLDATHGFKLTHSIRLFAEKAQFLCELVEAESIGREPIEVRSFYFREYSPFATDKLKLGHKSVPNLWQAPKRDCWLSAEDGRYLGGMSQAPTVAMFTYHLMNEGKSQHPDAMFTPERPLTLRPGEKYRPEGKMWMLAVGGLDGWDGWRHLSPTQL